MAELKPWLKLCMAELKPCMAELLHVLYDFACGWVVCMAELKPAHAAPRPWQDGVGRGQWALLWHLPILHCNIALMHTPLYVSLDTWTRATETLGNTLVSAFLLHYFTTAIVYITSLYNAEICNILQLEVWGPSGHTSRLRPFRSPDFVFAPFGCSGHVTHADNQ